MFNELRESILAERPGAFLTEEQRKELQRRAAEDDADPDGGIPWEQVERDVLARLRK